MEYYVIVYAVVVGGGWIYIDFYISDVNSVI